MGATSINQGRVIVAMATHHFCGFTQFSVSPSGQGGGGGGGGSGAFCSTQSFRDPGSFHLVAPLYSESLGSSPFNR